MLFWNSIDCSYLRCKRPLHTQPEECGKQRERKEQRTTQEQAQSIHSPSLPITITPISTASNREPVQGTH